MNSTVVQSFIGLFIDQVYEDAALSLIKDNLAQMGYFYQKNDVLVEFGEKIKIVINCGSDRFDYENFVLVCNNHIDYYKYRTLKTRKIINKKSVKFINAKFEIIIKL